MSAAIAALYSCMNALVAAAHDPESGLVNWPHKHQELRLLAAAGCQAAATEPIISLFAAWLECRLASFELCREMWEYEILPRWMSLGVDQVLPAEVNTLTATILVHSRLISQLSDQISQLKRTAPATPAPATPAPATPAPATPAPATPAPVMAPVIAGSSSESAGTGSSAAPQPPTSIKPVLVVKAIAKKPTKAAATTPKKVQLPDAEVHPHKSRAHDDVEALFGVRDALKTLDKANAEAVAPNFASLLTTIANDPKVLANLGSIQLNVSFLSGFETDPSSLQTLWSQVAAAAPSERLNKMIETKIVQGTGGD